MITDRRPCDVCPHVNDESACRASDCRHSRDVSAILAAVWCGTPLNVNQQVTRDLKLCACGKPAHGKGLCGTCYARSRYVRKQDRW